MAEKHMTMLLLSRLCTQGHITVIGRPRYNTGTAMFHNTLGIGVEVTGYWTRPFYVALDGKGVYRDGA